MSLAPTVIVMAEPMTHAHHSQHAHAPAHTCTNGAEAAPGPMASFSTLDTLLRRVMACGLPLLLVAPPDQAAAASQLVQPTDILTTGAHDRMTHPSDWLVRGMAAGVMARSQSPGWIVLPADMPMLQTQTLLSLAHKLSQGPIAYPCYRHVRGHPVGFASELYSELVRLDSEQALRRLAARYPAIDVNVDDPGIHMTMETNRGLDQLRAQLTGTPRPVWAARAFSH